MSTQVPISFSAWWLILIPILLILLNGIIVLIVNHLVKTKQKKMARVNIENKNCDDKTLTSWIEKKDLLYWLLIICLGTISLFTFRYKNATEVISHWGFAGTIVSIILAVVAIGFTLFQTLSSNLSSEKIAVSADKIEKATMNLDTKTLLESSEIMNNAATFLKEKILTIEERLYSLDEEQKRFNEIAATGFSNIKNETLLPDGQGVYNLNKFIDEIYINLPYKPKIYIYTYFRLNMLGIFVSDLVQSEMVNAITDYDKIVQLGEELYLKGANMGSQGATLTFVINLGILTQFLNSSKEEKEEIIKKCVDSLDGQMHYIGFIDSFINNKFNSIKNHI